MILPPRMIIEFKLTGFVWSNVMPIARCMVVLTSYCFAPSNVTLVIVP